MNKSKWVVLVLGNVNQLCRSFFYRIFIVFDKIDSLLFIQTNHITAPNTEKSFTYSSEQECIPVGCVLPAHWPHLVVSAWGGGVCVGGCMPGGVRAWGTCVPHTTSPVNRMTDTWENITLSLTSFAGGKNKIDCQGENRDFCLIFLQIWTRQPSVLYIQP